MPKGVVITHSTVSPVVTCHALWHSGDDCSDFNPFDWGGNCGPGWWEFRSLEFGFVASGTNIGSIDWVGCGGAWDPDSPAYSDSVCDGIEAEMDGLEGLGPHLVEISGSTSQYWFAVGGEYLDLESSRHPLPLVTFSCDDYEAAPGSEWTGIACVGVNPNTEGGASGVSNLRICDD
jgi:hypothetical protein